MKFKAFISYSHAADGQLAPALQSGLQRFAKPWNRARALRVFRDQTDLGVNPGLWSSVEGALRESEWLLLLASPEAARSKWVGKEVSFWREARSYRAFLIVLTEGEVVWRDEAGDFDWGRTTALPQSMQGFFPEEPRILDLRWAKNRDELSLSHPTFRQAIAEIAAPLHGREKADLESEEVRQERKARRIRRIFIVGLMGFAGTTAVGAGLAYLAQKEAKRQASIAEVQRDSAFVQRQRADHNAQVADSQRRLAVSAAEAERAARLQAESRQLAALAEASLTSDPLRALVLATDAARRAPTFEAEDALRKGLGASHLRATIRHPDVVWSVAFDPTGRLVASAGARGIAELSEVATGAVVARLLGHEATVTLVRFSPNGRYVATASVNGVAYIWDARDGRRLAELPHPGPVASLAFDASGDRLVTAGANVVERNGVVMIWRVPDGTPLAHVGGHRDKVVRATFSPDGTRLATVSFDGTARIWNAHTGAPVASFDHGNPVLDVSFSPDGSRIVTVDAGVPGRTEGGAKGRIWDLERREQVAVLRGQVSMWLESAPGTATFSRDGTRILTVGINAGIHLWNAESGDSLMSFGERALLDPDSPVNAAFGPGDGLVMTARYDGKVAVWDVATGRQLVSFSHGSPLTHADISADGRSVATAGHDGAIRIWTVESGEEFQHLRRGVVAIRDAAFTTRGGHVVTATTDSTVEVWDPATGTAVAEWRAGGSVLGIRVALSGDQLLTFNANEVGVWDAHSFAARSRIRGHVLPIQDAAFSPDGRLIATASVDGTGRIWNAATGAQLLVLDHGAQVYRVAFSLDGRQLVTAGSGGFAVVWATTTGQRVATLRPSPGERTVFRQADGRSQETPAELDGVKKIVFGDSGRRVATVSHYGSARLWDLEAARSLLWPWHRGFVSDVAVSPDGTRFATAGGDHTIIWDPETGRPLVDLPGGTQGFTGVAFGPDGTRVVTVTGDTGAVFAHVWDLASGRRSTTLRGHAGIIRQALFWTRKAEFSPDGRMILTMSGDGTARLFLVRLQDLVTLAETRLARSLTPEERRELLAR